MISTYTIKDLSQIIRIKPHTLRIWEQRYGFINPKRTEINTRLYCQEDLKYLLNISILYNEGHKISHIAKLSKEELTEKVRNFSENKLEHPTRTEELVLTMLEMDEERFEKQLNANIEAFGLESTIINVVYPFLSHIGILWQTDTINPAQEHFITNLIRQKLIVAIDSISPEIRKKDSKSILLYTPEGELHEISLLFACYIIKNSGHKCIYLGQSLPIADIKLVEKSHKPDVIFTVITSNPCQEDVQPYIDQLANLFPDTAFWLTGYQIVSQEINIPQGFKIIRDPSSIKRMLEE